MSGIYIPDMEIPKDGYRQLFLTAEGEIIWFPTSPRDGDIKRQAIPVPDHGDLIDRDALDADLEKQDMRTGEWDAIGFSIFEIDNAPTIIPADKESV